MTKRTITRWWIWGLLAFVPAGILIPSGVLALAAHHAGANDGYGKTMVGLVVLGGLFAVGGIIVQLVAWTGALLNTRPLSDTRWFTALLLGGIVGIVTTPVFGLGALIVGSVMLAYLVAGPDGLAAEARPTTPPKRTITKWSDRGFAAVAAGFGGALVVSYLTDRGGPLEGHTLSALALLSVGFTVAAVGVIVVCAAWWGALFNAHGLADKTWFKRLQWSGIAAAVTMPLFGLGGLILAVVLTAYRHAAPDGITGQRPARTEPNKLATGS